MSEAGAPEKKRWYNQELPTVPPAFRDLLIHYAKVKPEDVNNHIMAIREEAWKIKDYPCIGQFRFMALSLPDLPAYAEVLERLKTKDEKFLDLGCCLGQDLRVLLDAGVSGKKLYGADLEQPFINAGYKLFRDQETSNLRFIHADIFNHSGWKELDHQMNIIHAGSFLHLWDWDEQVQVCKRMVTLLVPQAGSLVIGRQMGSVKAIRKETPAECDLSSRSTWMHDVESFKKMWDEVGRQTGTKWDVHCELQDPHNEGLRDFSQRPRIWSGYEDIRRLVFCLRRL